MSSQQLVDLFRQKAELVSAKVLSVASMKDAYAYTLDVCLNKDACQLLISGCEGAISDAAAALCDAKAAPRIVAAPQLAKGEKKKKDKDKDKKSKDKGWALFEEMAKEKGVQLLGEGLRQHLAGIDIGFTVADYGIAETGSLVIDSADEDVRLSTMVSEIHVAVLPLDKLKATAYDLEEKLEKRMKDAPSFLAFITGASRTADIERVLAIGVHGPLELHILLLED